MTTRYRQSLNGDIGLQKPQTFPRETFCPHASRGEFPRTESQDNNNRLARPRTRRIARLRHRPTFFHPVPDSLASLIPVHNSLVVLHCSCLAVDMDRLDTLVGLVGIPDIAGLDNKQLVVGRAGWDSIHC